MFSEAETVISELLAGVLALAFASGAPADCRVDGAQYAMRGAPQFTAVFRQAEGARSAHDLILDVRSRDTGRTYSFTINRGNGYGEATLSPVQGSWVGPVEVYTLDDEEKFTDYFGGRENPAPKRLLMPKLGPALWYQVDSLTGVGNSERERMPRAFFDRVACGPV